MAGWGTVRRKPTRLKCAESMAVELQPQRLDAANVRGFPLKI
jgi:hypothetical protein